MPMLRWVPIDIAARVVDDGFVAKVFGEAIVPGGECAGSARDRQSQDVKIIRAAAPPCTQCGLLLGKGLVLNAAQTTRSLQGDEKSSDWLHAAQFLR
jgi:hypothetical protein